MSFGEWALLTSDIVAIGEAFVAQAINDGEGGDGSEVRQGLMIRGTTPVSSLSLQHGSVYELYCTGGVCYKGSCLVY